MTLFEGTPLLCVVLDANGFGERPGERARALFASGADWIQLRDRALPDAPLLEIARALVATSLLELRELLLYPGGDTPISGDLRPLIGVSECF